MQFIGMSIHLADYTDNFSIGQNICQYVFLSVKLAVGFHLFDDVMSHCFRGTTTAITQTRFVSTDLLQVCVQTSSAKSQSVCDDFHTPVCIYAMYDGSHMSSMCEYWQCV